MTRVVIFDPEDMEPLTVFDVSADWLRRVERGEAPNPLRFIVQMPLRFVTFPTDEEVMASINEPLPIAVIRFERFIYRNVTTWFGMALNPEMALLLRSEFLPGQQKEAWAERRRGFSEGVTQAFRMLGYGD